MPGAPFIPPEWLAEVLIAWLYDHFGWAGLVATTAFCLAATLALLLRLLLRGLEPVHAMIATALAWILALTHALARPHIFAPPLLILSIGAALITPFGVEGLMLPFTFVRMSYSLAVITEWQSPDFQQYQPLELWIIFVLFAALSRGWRLPPIRVGIVV